MEKAVKEELIEYYQHKFKQYGYDSRSVDWVKGRQQFRFSILAEIGLINGGSILDVGCGFADFYAFLQKQEWQGKYKGIDLLPEFVNIAKEKYPNLDVNVFEFLEQEINETFDYVVESGIFNIKLFDSDEKHWDYVQQMLRKMFSLSNIGISANFLSSYVDYQQDQNWHANEEEMFKFCKTLSKRIVIRHDYMPYEFTIYLYKDDSVSKDNVFQDCIGQSLQRKKEK